MHMGRVNISVLTIPAVTTAFLPAVLPSAFCLVISRETVTGTPLEDTVRNTENTESAIWYMPSPSAPISLESTMRYIKLSVFSMVEKTVTCAVVL